MQGGHAGWAQLPEAGTPNNYKRKSGLIAQAKRCVLPKIQSFQSRQIWEFDIRTRPSLVADALAYLLISPKNIGAFGP